MQVVRFHQYNKPINYCDRSCRMAVYHFDSRTAGKRVVFRRWYDNGSCDVRVIKGDGRTANFTEFKQLDFTASAAEGVDFLQLAKSLADEHFA